ncbi:MAG: SUMF1/EgtB/PvdO family nonheme iron enzyme [Saprospiraceae bacterium]|nr:SUMF1/EgtB/PvdO family nonheme iron enzyme [Saprospiraceae bacterium]
MNRYPGIRPFTAAERPLFFGRDDDIERLIRLIRVAQLTVLYGRSGYGKSSLLQAGVLPLLRDEGDTPFSEVRIGPYKPGESPAPVQTLLSAAQASGGEAPDSLWQAFKQRQLRGEGGRFLLFFDQFEELFTYPAEQILAFKQQLAEALYALVPDRYGRAAAQLPAAERAAFFTPFELKVVFAIRSDRMSQLNTLKDYLPNLLQHSYELDALDEQAATQAITAPAALPQSAGFGTPPFQYSPEALAAIIGALRDERGRLETSALQIVCRHVEDNIVARYQTTLVSAGDLGDLQSVFADFYNNTLAALPVADQAEGRRLCEDVLVSPEGVRLPFAAQALTAQGFSPALLEALSRASLLRVERDEQGRMLYEIGHDTLVPPILNAAKLRREEAEKRRLLREAVEAKHARQEAERKQRRAYLLTAGAVLLALLAVGASYFAYLKSREASEKARLVLEKEEQVRQAEGKIAEKTVQAAEALRRADEKEAEAKRNYDEAQRQKTATAEQKRLAAEALAQARAERRNVEIATTGIVQNLVENADKKIFHLDYVNAVSLLNEAYDLVRDRDDDSPLAIYRDPVAYGLLEMAFFYIHTGQYTYARYELETAGKLYGQSFPELGGIVTVDQPDNRDKLEQVFRRFWPERFRELEARYFPDMVNIPAGEFMMGCDSTIDSDCNPDEFPQHPVRLSAFEIARTETTMWQYNLFCMATGRDIKNFHENAWGEPRGSDPVINASWYDAALYANWCSVQAGLEPVYVFADTTGKEPSKWQVDTRFEAKGYRLPTEAEWEYAARGGERHIYSGSNDFEEVAWNYLNSVGRTQPTGAKRANAFGLYDMSGNVWEWCGDDYEERYYQSCFEKGLVVDPVASNWEKNRAVLRGSSWVNSHNSCRAANRGRNNRNDRRNDNGFRCARDGQ